MFLNFRWKVACSFVDKSASVFRTKFWVHKTVQSSQQKFLMLGIFHFLSQRVTFFSQLFFSRCYNLKTSFFAENQLFKLWQRFFSNVFVLGGSREVIERRQTGSGLLLFYFRFHSSKKTTKKGAKQWFFFQRFFCSFFSIFFVRYSLYFFFLSLYFFPIWLVAESVWSRRFFIRFFFESLKHEQSLRFFWKVFFLKYYNTI